MAKAIAAKTDANPMNITPVAVCPSEAIVASLAPVAIAFALATWMIEPTTKPISAIPNIGSQSLLPTVWGRLSPRL